jgi:hypothetical protein
MNGGELWCQGFSGWCGVDLAALRTGRVTATTV